MPDTPQPKAWNDWYRFARDKLGLLHEECTEYANLRFVEEQNRASLRARGQDAAHAVYRHQPGLRPG
jgi:hypothetical protein